MNTTEFMAITVLLASLGSLSACCSGKASVAGGNASGQNLPHTEKLPESQTDRSPIILSEGRIAGGAVRAMPKAVVYRMSGDYARNVSVTLGADGTLASYPAPSDVSEASAPVQMSGGWWLDRRGIGMRSVFTRYTYGEYSRLERVPSQAELLESVIPGARVTEVMQLPMTPSEAAADTAAVNAYIRSHTPVLTVP